MYSNLNLCSELSFLISSNASNREIASWAFDRALQNDLDQFIKNKLDELSLIDEPGFEISRKEMLMTCNKLLSEYIDSMDE